jgi:hypothetical protein
MNGIRVAAEFAQGNVNAHIAQELAARPTRDPGTLSNGAAKENSGSESNA